MNDRGLVPGIVLLTVGAYILLSRSFGLRGPGPILLLIGTALLVLSALRRWRGPIAPGTILIGLGAGFLLQGPWESFMPRWATLVLGLGIGFLLAAALEAAAGRLRRPGPIVPGVILTAVASIAAIGERLDLSGFLVWIGMLWPWLLLVAGAALVIGSLRRKP